MWLEAWKYNTCLKGETRAQGSPNAGSGEGKMYTALPSQAKEAVSKDQTRDAQVTVDQP